MFISYLRVSTTRQGQSGLGLDAQRGAVAKFLKGEEPVSEYVEVESGRKSSRPKLTAAIAEAKARKATLVVAKLDRLARNARFLLEVVESGVNVVFCELPEVPAGAFGKFMLSVMAAVAELESGLISERTKAALAVAKKRGTKLGKHGKVLAKKSKADAKVRAEEWREIFVECYRDGCRSSAVFAAMLNKRGYKTENGKRWHPATARRVMERLGPLG